MTQVNVERVVHVDGKSIKSCTALAADIEGSKVTTIEGLVSNGKMHPMQEAFKKTTWFTMWILYTRNGYECN